MKNGIISHKSLMNCTYSMRRQKGMKFIAQKKINFSLKWLDWSPIIQNLARGSTKCFSRRKIRKYEKYKKKIWHWTKSYFSQLTAFTQLSVKQSQSKPMISLLKFKINVLGIKKLIDNLSSSEYGCISCIQNNFDLFMNLGPQRILHKELDYLSFVPFK